VNPTRGIVVLLTLSVVIRTSLELQEMSGVESSCNIFEWGREIKKVGNHLYGQTSVELRQI